MKKQTLKLLPIDYVGRTCSSCSHTRKNSDPLPIWACPACGVAYTAAKSAEDQSGQFYAVRVQRAPEDSFPKKGKKAKRKMIRKAARASHRKTMRNLIAGALMTLSVLGTLIVYEYNRNMNAFPQQQERWTEQQKLHLVDENDTVV